MLHNKRPCPKSIQVVAKNPGKGKVGRVSLRLTTIRQSLQSSANQRRICYIKNGKGNAVACGLLLLRAPAGSSRLGPFIFCCVYRGFYTSILFCWSPLLFTCLPLESISKLLPPLCRRWDGNAIWGTPQSLGKRGFNPSALPQGQFGDSYLAVWFQVVKGTRQLRLAHSTPVMSIRQR